MRVPLKDFVTICGFLLVLGASIYAAQITNPAALHTITRTLSVRTRVVFPEFDTPQKLYILGGLTFAVDPGSDLEKALDSKVGREVTVTIK
jgi:hypothetical protein